MSGTFEIAPQPVQPASLPRIEANRVISRISTGTATVISCEPWFW
jgi:hypothetical protein